MAGEFLNHFTPKARWAVTFAAEEAGRLGHAFVAPEHLLLGLLGLGSGGALTLLWKFGINLESLRTLTESSISDAARNEPGLNTQPLRPTQRKSSSPIHTPRLKKTLSLAAAEAKTAGRTEVSSEDLLIGLLLEGKSGAAAVLKSYNLTSSRFREAAAGLKDSSEG